MGRNGKKRQETGEEKYLKVPSSTNKYQEVLRSTKKNQKEPKKKENKELKKSKIGRGRVAKK